MSDKLEALDKVCEMGDCIIIQNNKQDIISDAIEWFENGKVSHVAMYLGGGQNLISEFCIEGAVVNRITRYCKDQYTVYVRRIKGITVDQASKMKDAGYKSAFNKEKYGFFSYLGYIVLNLYRKIVRQIFGRKIADAFLMVDNPFSASDTEVCSSGYDKWAKAGGIDLFPGVGNQMVTPEHLLESEKLETILTV